MSYQSPLPPGTEDQTDFLEQNQQYSAETSNTSQSETETFLNYIYNVPPPTIPKSFTTPPPSASYGVPYPIVPPFPPPLPYGPALVQPPPPPPPPPPSTPSPSPASNYSYTRYNLSNDYVPTYQSPPLPRTAPPPQPDSKVRPAYHHQYGYGYNYTQASYATPYHQSQSKYYGNHYNKRYNSQQPRPPYSSSGSTYNNNGSGSRFSHQATTSRPPFNSAHNPRFKPPTSQTASIRGRFVRHNSVTRNTPGSVSERNSKPETERDRLLKIWRSHYCDTAEEIQKKLTELANYDGETTQVWIRSSPADLFYRRSAAAVNEMNGTSRLEGLCRLFDELLMQRADRVRKTLPPYEPPVRKPKRRVCKHKSEACSSDDDSSDDELKLEQDNCMEELSRKLQHPYRIHPDLWHNERGEMNDGPLCRCSARSRRIGIRHAIYPGETGYTKCNPNSNNASKLYHYRITITPPTNFLTKTPTMIKHDEHEFLFEGFSLFSHFPLGDLPTCKVIRFNIEYTILYFEEKMPENFTIAELDLFTKYLFYELLELLDFTLFPHMPNSEETSCPAFHFMPRFVRDLPDNGKEVLAMCYVLRYLLDNAIPIVDEATLTFLYDIPQHEWQDYVDDIRGMLVTKPGYKPCSVRVDQLDRNDSDLKGSVEKDADLAHPVIVHFGMRPPQLSYAGNPEYQRAWREYVKYRHLMANMSKPSFKDKRKLEEKESRLQDMRAQSRMKRNVTVVISSKGYYRTGIMCDIVQHAMLIPVLVGHLRFHKSLNLLEENIGYKFKNRYLLQLALTHPSYKENYGTNPDHARNSVTNCGIRQPEYGDRKIHYMNTRKRGINTLINIMSRFGKTYEAVSNITHNERLEFLGDAVVEFLSSIHLFFMFPELEEGGLATYRAAIVQNQHLAILAKKLHLEEYMLYAHGSDLCHELELRHAMANCFEALMGALLLDGGISIADNVFMNALFMEEDPLLKIWKKLPKHPLQEQEPFGDRAWIKDYPLLQDLTKFEDSIGVTFKHVRLLARAFTDRSIGFTHLTLGSNQRLEFLGDTVLQLICSEYLYRHFPEHHEGHLSLLRSSLVNNRTQAVVCDDLGMTKYAVYSNPKAELKTKDRADLLEAFLGALYVDKGLLFCEQFCHVCFFPRLQMFIMNQDWNDPKSKLQQCCLTLRTLDGGEPDIPLYKVVESKGPTNTRIYTVAVYFRLQRLATSTGSSIQQAEMNAAKAALENSSDLFPQLDHQKRVIVKSIQRQTGGELQPEMEKILQHRKRRKPVPAIEDESHLPKQYRLREDISSDELPDDDEDMNNNENGGAGGGGGGGGGDDGASDDSDTDSSGTRCQKEEINNTKNSKEMKRNARNSYDSSDSPSESDKSTSPDKRKQKRCTRKRVSSICSSQTGIFEKLKKRIQSDSKICEDVSSDEFFDESRATKGKTVHKYANTMLYFNVQSEASEASPKTNFSDLKDLVEDVSSGSDIESGEVTN